MRLYKSDGKVFAKFEETIELCDFSHADTLSKYKEELLKKIADRFDWTVAEAALKGMEENESKPLLQSEESPKSESSEPNPESNIEKPKRKGRKRIDIGKIMALKNAGWSNIQIADEMGMTANNVAQVIYQHKKKCESE